MATMTPQNSDLNSRVSVTEAYVKEIKEAVYRMEKINSNNREDFLEANTVLRETALMQKNQEEKISVLTDNIDELTKNVHQLSLVTAEMNSTKKTIELLAEDVAELKSEVTDLKNGQRTRQELEKEKTKMKYGLWAALATGIISAVVTIVTSVIA